MKALAFAFLLLLAGCASTKIKTPNISIQCNKNDIDEILQSKLKELLKANSKQDISLACKSLEFSGAARGLIYYTGLDNGGYAKHKIEIWLLDKDTKPKNSLIITNEINSGAYELEQIIQKTADKIILNLKEKQWI